MSRYRADLARYLDGEAPTLKGVVRAMLSEVSLQVIFFYRLGRALKERSGASALSPFVLFGWVIYGVFAPALSKAYGIRLRLSADIGPGIYIGHFGGIEIANCRVGSNCTVGEMTTIGSAAELDGPSVGDRVWIGGHVHVASRVRIGSGATIASGSTVVQDVGDRCLIVGRPGRVVSRDYDNARLLGAVATLQVCALDHSVKQ